MKQWEKINAQYRARITNRATAIRAFCVECMGGQPSYVKRCTAKNCPLFLFRMGKDPFHSKSRSKISKGAETDDLAVESVDA